MRAPCDHCRTAAAKHKHALAAAGVALLAALGLAAPARGAFGPCPPGTPSGVSCETVAVPLDRSGAVPGSVHLFVERVPGTAPVHGAIIALAGGPGQAATPLTGSFADVLAPAMRGRDLIVFDQRGSGRSDPIDCPSLDGPAASNAAVTACAVHLGRTRGLYTSRDSADDIDAIRQTLGLQRISVYGASYGTYTALTYARRYPQHVESLVLDSVIAPDGRDPFERTMFAAIRRVVGGLCVGDCRRITRHPLRDLSKVVRRARRRPLTASGFSARGRRLKLRVTAETLLASTTATDLDPTARAEIPAVYAAALRGDTAPLARLLLRERPLTGDATNDSEAALFIATGCEEMPLPWSRTAPLSRRPRSARATIARVRQGAFAPWTRAIELRTGISSACLGWPDASAQSPAIGGPAPDVPVLELEGADDTRTPVADAQAVAGLFPHASLVVVPYTGHSVLGTDVSGCATDALTRFYSGQPVVPCRRAANPFPPVHLPPASLRGVRARALRGLRGRTLAAVEDTLSDATRQALDVTLFSTRIAAGGLRGGFMRGSLTPTRLSIRLHRFSSIAGVVLDGSARLELSAALPHFAHVRVSGSGAHGTLTFTNRTLTGRLGGRQVNLVAAAGVADQRWVRALRQLAGRALILP